MSVSSKMPVRKESVIAQPEPAPVAKPKGNAMAGRAQSTRIKTPTVKGAEKSAPIKSRVPDVPESKKADSQKKKRLSKAFSRPLDKKLKQETLVRDRFTFPEDEYVQLTGMKKRLLVQGRSVKKSELVRAGLLLLSALDDDELKELLAKVPAVG